MSKVMTFGMDLAKADFLHAADHLELGHFINGVDVVDPLATRRVRCCRE